MRTPITDATVLFLERLNQLRKKAHEIASMVIEFGVNQVPIFLKFGLVPKAFWRLLGRLLKIFLAICDLRECASNPALFSVSRILKKACEQV